ncbi:MAG: hypothetical protein ABIS86_05250, partial [Streptosporangiaceae bacterium]
MDALDQPMIDMTAVTETPRISRTADHGHRRKGVPTGPFQQMLHLARRPVTRMLGDRPAVLARQVA